MEKRQKTAASRLGSALGLWYLVSCWLVWFFEIRSLLSLLSLSLWCASGEWGAAGPGLFRCGWLFCWWSSEGSRLQNGHAGIPYISPGFHLVKDVFQFLSKIPSSHWRFLRLFLILTIDSMKKRKRSIKSTIWRLFIYSY